MAARNGQDAVSRVLLEEYAKLHPSYWRKEIAEKNNEGKTAPSLALLAKKPTIGLHLLEEMFKAGFRADVAAEDESLKWASDAGQVKLVQLLYEMGVCNNKKDVDRKRTAKNEKWTPLHWAVSYADKDVVFNLLAKGGAEMLKAKNVKTARRMARIMKWERERKINARNLAI